MYKEYAIAAFDVKTAVVQVVQEAMNTPEHAVSLMYVKTDETVKAQGPAYVAECANRWATEVLNKAKAAGKLERIEPHDILIGAAVAMSDTINAYAI